MKTYSIITGTGCYIPNVVKTNLDFTTHKFYADDFSVIETEPEIVVEKFKQITGISERRYADALAHARRAMAIRPQALFLAPFPIASLRLAANSFEPAPPHSRARVFQSSAPCWPIRRRCGPASPCHNGMTPSTARC